MIKLSTKDKSNNYLNNFKDIYGKINQLRNFGKGYGSLIMTLNLDINPNLTVEISSRLYT
jgi:hypothetical protein